MSAWLRAMHPFPPMLLFSAFNHSYIDTIGCPPLLVVSLRCPQLPWGLRESWRQKYFSNLSHSMDTQVVKMDDWGYILKSLKFISDEAAGFYLGCWHSPLALHYYYWINISDIQSQTYFGSKAQLFLLPSQENYLNNPSDRQKYLF